MQRSFEITVQWTHYKMRPPLVWEWNEDDETTMMVEADNEEEAKEEVWKYFWRTEVEIVKIKEIVK